MKKKREASRISIEIDRSLRSKFRALAILNETSMTDMITKYIKSEINKTGK